MKSLKSRRFGALLPLLVAFHAAPALAVNNATLTNPSPADPVAGETVSFTLSASNFQGVNGADFQLADANNIDGAPLARHQNSSPSDPTSAVLTTSYGTPGSYSVLANIFDGGVSPGSPGSFSQSSTKTFTVWPVLSASIAAVSGTPKMGTTVPLSASASGGKPNLTYTWDLDGDGFDDGAGATLSAVFTTGSPGPRDVRVRVADGATPSHVVIATRAVTLAAADPPIPTTPTTPTTPSETTPAATTPAATTPGGTTPAPSTPGCTKELAWAVYQVTTTGCFTKSGDKFTATAQVKLNGIVLEPTSAKPFTVTPGSATQKGSVSLKGAAISINGTTVFRGDIDWSLPPTKQGAFDVIAKLTVPSGARIFGLSVSGTVDLQLGRENGGRYYANFPLNIGLPEIFKSAPESKAPGLTSKVVFSVDATGVRNAGLKLQATNAYLGKLKVESVCFAYAPAGQTAINGCQAPSLDGKPYLTCNENTSSDRWSGSAVVVLPTESKTRVAAFGSVADNKLASLGGFADNLGKSVPLASGVYLNRIGVGVCINPPPVKVRGDVGIAILPPPSGPPTVAINGYFLYTDAFGKDPWSLELGGTVYVYTKQVGSGKVIIKGSGALDFEVNVGLDLGPISVGGGVSGWIEPSIKRFLIQGYVKGCIWTICARADGLVSNLGLAGCVDLGSITYWTLERDADWTWWAWWRLHWVTHVVQLKGGFGYTWSTSSVSLLGSSCDFGPWTPRRTMLPGGLGNFQQLGLPTGEPSAVVVSTSGRRAQAAAQSVVVRDGTPALALRIRGSDIAPKVKLTGPDGAVIASPIDSPSAQVAGQWMIAENPTDATTSVVLLSPKTGTWTVEPLPGSDIATIEESPYEGEPQVVGGVGAGKGGAKTLNLAFTIPGGTELSIEEGGADGAVHQTLAGSVKGGKCSQVPDDSPGGAGVQCASLRFTPAAGPGGKRSIYAVVLRDGIPVSRTVVATYTATGWVKPARPSAVSITRKGSRVTVAWAKSAGADRYAISVQGSDGTSVAFDLAGRCRALRVEGLGSSVTVKARVTGVRQDEEAGKARAVTLKAGKAKTGGRKVKATPLCR